MTRVRAPRPLLAMTALAPLVLVGACASFPAMKANVITPVTLDSGAAAGVLPKSAIATDPLVRKPLTDAQIATLVSNEPLTVVLPPQPLPQMLQTIFGDLLKVPYVLGPGVAERTDGAYIRGVDGMSRREFFRAVQTGLTDYGLGLYLDKGVVTVFQTGGERQLPASVVRAYTPGTPEAARPAEQSVALLQVKADAAVRLLQDVMPSASDVRLAPDPVGNTVQVAGAARDVGMAVTVLRYLDRPEFAGRVVTRIEPVYFSADDLANALEDTLASQGLGVSRRPSASPLIVLSFPDSNQVLVFANNASLLAQVQTAVSKLDQPSALGDQPGTFVYQVRNTDASGLGALVSGMPAPAAAGAAAPVGVPGTPAANTFGAASNVSATGAPVFPSSPAAITGGGFMTGRVVVDPVGNRILFTGQPAEFVQLRSLLTRLDTAPRQVLVEVTIAEVTLDDQTRLGLEYFFSASMGDGKLRGGTLGGLGLKSGGLSLNFKGSDLRAQFNAFASNSKVNILSRPRLVARSGSEAAIQVGTDVPIITSQAAAPVQSGGTSEVLQSIQYRQTGVILKIRPIVYGDNRIDLQISQEVSSQQANPNSAIGSPLILNREVTTQLSLAEGATAVLGGLIENNYTKGNTGIPLIKDIPVLGQAFRVDSVAGNKTELVLLVTPYILRDAGEMSAFARTYASDINAAFRVGRGSSYTLTAWTGPGVGRDLPQVEPASERPR
jgi:general secretion pathway protein D